MTSQGQTKTARIFLILLALAEIVCAPAWADKTITLHPSAAETATGQSALTFDTSGYQAMSCGVSITAGSGTLSALNIYVQGSYDGGTTWFDLLTDAGFTTTATMTGAGTAATYTTLRREIFTSAAIVTTSTQAYGIFKEPPPPLLRAAWGITVTSAPSETFTLLCNLKD